MLETFSKSLDQVAPMLLDRRRLKPWRNSQAARGLDLALQAIPACSQAPHMFGNWLDTMIDTRHELVRLAELID